tara:strand:- start:1429 stop:1893 length:465 start_codon:yes stop_codon:yes gene_type:complete
MKFRHKLDQFVSWFLIIIMFVMVLAVLWQVFSRYILENPSSYTEELARYLMIWVGVLGAAYVSGKNNHVSIDYFYKKFSVDNQEIIRKIIISIIILFVLSVFVFGGFRLVYITYILSQYSPALQIPLALVYLIIPLSGLLIIYYKVSEILINNK